MDTLWHIGRVRARADHYADLRAVLELSPPCPPDGSRCCQEGRRAGGISMQKSSSYVAEMSGCHILTKNVSDMVMPLRELVSKLSIRQRMPQIEVAVGGDGRTALVFRVLETPTEADMALLNAFGAEYKADIWLQPKGPDSACPVDPANIDALGLQLPEFGVRINFKPTDFTQVNHELNETMVSRAVRLLGVEPGHKVATFSAGLGNFTLPLATRSAHVTGIEGSEALVARARQGAADQRPRRQDRLRGPQPSHVVRSGLGSPLEEEGWHRPCTH